MTWIALLMLLLAGPKALDKPNIIFIMADDLGYAEVGCYGQKKIETPHLDRLARGGLRFTHFYSGSPVCAPSRCVLLTGKHTGHAYIRDNGELPTEGQRPLPEGTFTLGRMLQLQGYVTCVIGKWGLGGPDSSGEPNRQGFDHWFGYLCQRHAHNYYPRYLWRNGEKVVLEGNDRGLTGKHYAPDLMMDEARGFIRKNKGNPFFLYLATPVPHAAIQVPEDSLEHYRGRWEDPPYTGNKGYLPHPAPRAGYAAMVTRMDRGIGTILDLLKELGLEDRTLVCFTSDNGPTFNGGSDSAFFESAGPLRGLKCSVYEGGIRVPMIVRWPGHTAPGTVTHHVSALWDVMPTLAGVVKAKLPEDLDGVSFLPTLLGEEGQEEHDYLYWEYRSRQAQAVRMGDWKAIRRIMKGTFELYDLKEDIGESIDVAGDHPEVAEKMRAIMETGRTDSEAFPLAASPRRHRPDTDLPVIPRTEWKLVRVDSESRFNGKLGIHAFDGYAHTWWHSKWYDTEPALPHEIVIDLGKAYEVRGFCYLPRNDGGRGGMIADYTFYVSNDPGRWEAPAAKGRFGPGKKEKEITFPSVRGRYVRLQGLSAQDGKPHTSVAELNILGK
jgi:arylsulfatase